MGINPKNRRKTSIRIESEPQVSPAASGIAAVELTAAVGPPAPIDAMGRRCSVPGLSHRDDEEGAHFVLVFYFPSCFHCLLPSPSSRQLLNLVQTSALKNKSRILSKPFLSLHRLGDQNGASPSAF